MEDSNRFGPYHDPNVGMLDDIFITDEHLGFDFPDSDQTLGQNRSFDMNVNNNRSSRFESTDNRLVGDYSSAGPSGFGNRTSGNDYSSAGPSGFGNRTSGNDTQNCNPESSNFGNSIQLSDWPVPPTPYTCTCCQVLREIFHTNGVETTKLEIHGRLGMICHAILEICISDTSNPNKTYKMFDFCKESLCSVKQFLVQYCEKRKQTGYTMMKDLLLPFYEVLSVGMDCDYNLDIDDILQESPVHIGETTRNQPTGAVNQVEVSQPQPQARYPERRPARKPLAAQRARTKNLRLKDFVEYFHLPVEGAARELGICTSVIKKVCRSEGLERWPYRKIKCIEKQIEERNRSLNGGDHSERARAGAEIQRLRRELDNIFQIRNNT